MKKFLFILLLFLGCGIWFVYGGQIKEQVKNKIETSDDANLSELKNVIQDGLDKTADTGSSTSDQKTEEEQAKVSITHESALNYAYETLSSEEQTTYDEMVYAIENFRTDFELTTTDLDELASVFSAVMADHGEYFWVQGYSYRSYFPQNDPEDITKLEFTPNFTMTKGEKEAAEPQVEAAAAVYLEGASQLGSDYAKALYLFERLITDVDYVENSAENQNILSVFLYRQTVCSGYAKAYQYLLSKLGIESAVVTGTAKGGSHAWNLVLLDGDFYYIDVTWGNSSYSMGEDAGQKYFINYGYFGATTEDLSRTHTDDGSITLPYCSATYDNYYIRSGLYVDTPDEAAMGTILANAYANGQTASLKFATRELYDYALSYFVTDQRIVDYCPGLTSIEYIPDEDLYILNFKF